jgi:hypothetical protein
METSAFDCAGFTSFVKVEAASAVLETGFGPPSKEANEELAVRAEAAGLDIDGLFRKAKEILAELKSRN